MAKKYHLALLSTAMGLLACDIGVSDAWAGSPMIANREALASQVPRAPCVGEGSWVWTRSLEQERRTSAALYNRYCIRCHGVDGRGVWDIPDVPNFVDACWQDSRSDEYIAQVLHFGRGAVMPQFRGTLTYDEYYGIARHLRGFDPRRQIPRPVSTGGSGMGTQVKPIPEPAGTQTSGRQAQDSLVKSVAMPVTVGEPKLTRRTSLIQRLRDLPTPSSR